MSLAFMENHFRAQYRFLNHGGDYSDLRCIDVNKQVLLDRSVLKGEEEAVKWCRYWSGKANCFIGRNPRNADGTVSRITAYSYDLDPERPKGTAADEGSLRTALQAGRLILQESGAGYLASSGNGALVLFRLAVPVCEDFKAFDAWLASRERHFQQIFSDRGLNVKCDSTHDAARITKCLGTPSTKGDRTLWRVSRFIDLPCPPYRLHAPDTRIPEPELQLAAVGPAPVAAVDIPGFGGRLGPAVALEKDGRGGARNMPVGALGERIDVASRALARLNPERREDYAQWLQVGMSLTELGIVGLQLWDAWSRPSPKYQEGSCATKWKTFKTNPQGGSQVSLGSLLHWADQDHPSGARPALLHGNVSDNGHDDALSLEAFMSDAAPVTWLCRPFIARSSIGFIAGLPETMKTWLMLDFAVECARGGGQWLGAFPLAGGRVLFIDQERAKSETQRRLQAVVKAKGLSFADLKNRLFIRTGASLRFDSDPSMASFKAFLGKHTPDIVIIDSFATAHGKEENSRSEIQTVMDRVKAIRNEFGCSIVFIDHENKGAFQAKENKEAPTAFRMAGSVAKPAAAEFVLTVRRFDPTTCIVHHTKSTLATASDSFSVRVEDVETGIVVRGQK